MARARSLSERITALANDRGAANAFWIGTQATTWQQYDARANELARQLITSGVAAGDRVGVWLPDGPGVHVAFLGVERVGAVIVGLGARSGPREIEHLMKQTGCVALITAREHQGCTALHWGTRLREQGVGLRQQIVVDPESGEWIETLARSNRAADARLDGLGRGPDEVWLINSTSGTTGMPKCVVHDQLRWFAFHEFAVAAGRLRPDDVFMSVVPAPFGFGIWTAHVTPAMLGAPVVLTNGFDVEATLEWIDRHRVTVLAAVSTQFIMMLNHPRLHGFDLSSLRVLFTGGEAVPRDRAAAFESETGAQVLQFYGSNEVGAVSCTTLDDPSEMRWTTAGRVIADMNVRLFDERGRDVTASGRGQPGCKGPTLSRGYYGDPVANAKLIRDDGWMLLGDIVTLDSEGYLRVAGRTDDFIIRGGKNISAAAVEEQVGTHPAVAHVGVVAMPDDVFGERVCAFVELNEGRALDIESLRVHLRDRGVSKELFPERLVVLDRLPRVAGGKLSKGELRTLAAPLRANRS